MHSHLCSPCREAEIEFGEDVAKKLKLSEDGKVVLWPQPTDDPEDPQNVRIAYSHNWCIFADNRISGL